MRNTVRVVVSFFVVFFHYYLFGEEITRPWMTLTDEEHGGGEHSFLHSHPKVQRLQSFGVFFFFQKAKTE